MSTVKQSLELNINNVIHQFYVEADKPLLWVLREDLRLTGTKYGCGIAYCGVCTVHLDEIAVRSCAIRVADAVGKKIRTIEGLAVDNQLHPVQRAWQELQVPQCGYCQSGQIMSACALLKKNQKPTEEQIHQFMSANLCRCGTYNKIKAAIQLAAKKMSSK